MYQEYLMKNYLISGYFQVMMKILMVSDLFLLLVKVLVNYSKLNIFLFIFSLKKVKSINEQQFNLSNCLFLARILSNAIKETSRRG
jgi:hypothetical protein